MTAFRGAVAMAAVALCVAACSRSSDGAAVAGDVAATTTRTTGTQSTTTSDSSHPDFGVVPTRTTPVPAGTITCAPGHRPPVGMVAKVADSLAPVVTVAVPDGWSMQGGSGDVGAQLQGPDGMSATVTIVPTTLAPQEAFAEYAEALTADAAVSSLSVLPAQLCDYSGQKLLGAVSDTPEDAIEFVDRVVHVWTNSRAYLVSVHAAAPTGTAGFDSAATQLTDGFEIRIP